jgi:hypothetical protein
MRNIEIEIRDVDTKRVIASSNRLVNDRDVGYLTLIVLNILDSIKTGRPNLYRSLKAKKESVDNESTKLW